MNGGPLLATVFCCTALAIATTTCVPQAAAVLAAPDPVTSASAAATAPAAAITSTPGASPSPAATPAAAATPLYTFVYRASPQPIPSADVPVIAEIDLNATEITPPAPLHVRVLTSIAVVSVTAQTSMAFMTRGIPIPKAQPGLFLFDGYVPDVPFFLRNHTFNVDFIATTASGRTTDVSLPLRLD
jgi:hypothetical protein